MALRITSTSIFSDTTAHTAKGWPVPGEPTLWTVTWLPGRNLTRNQAVTAMTLAETVAAAPPAGDKMWDHIAGWAQELGLPAGDVVAMVTELPSQLP